MRRSIGQLNANLSEGLSTAATGEPVEITRGKGGTDYVTIIETGDHRRLRACESIVHELMGLAAREADCIEYQSLANTIARLAEVGGLAIDLPGTTPEDETQEVTTT